MVNGANLMQVKTNEVSVREALVKKTASTGVYGAVKRALGRAKPLGLALGLSGAMLVPGLASADVTYDRARVVDVDPIYELVSDSVPVEQCREERVPVYRHHRANASAPILGAIIGGAIGNAVGHKKRNKQVGTVVGAMLGGAIGADVSRQNRHRDYPGERYRYEQVCDTHYEVRQHEQLTGYRVSYVYGGTTYSTRMRRDPGEYIRVRVRVSPAG